MKWDMEYTKRKLEIARQYMSEAILSTPTGDNRNKMSDIDIAIASVWHNIDRINKGD